VAKEEAFQADVHCFKHPRERLAHVEFKSLSYLSLGCCFL